MRLVITGSSGLIGSALTTAFQSHGHAVLRMVRPWGKQKGNDTAVWDPALGLIEPRNLEGADVVIHLSGASIAGLRWTARKRGNIASSRLRSTRLLATSLASMANPPSTFLVASAVGYYGDRGDERLSEESPPGTGFLADLAQEWEAAASPAAARGIRVVHLRTAVVLSGVGGSLSVMLRPFKLGVGGVLGNGRQWMSWVALEDVVGAIMHMLVTDSLTGPVNVCSPNPVTNRTFTQTVGRVLSRPTLIPVPAFALRLALGRMADELLLSSTRAEPRKLLDSGYRFHYPDLETTLRHALGKGA